MKKVILLGIFVIFLTSLTLGSVAQEAMYFQDDFFERDIQSYEIDRELEQKFNSEETLYGTSTGLSNQNICSIVNSCFQPVKKQELIFLDFNTISRNIGPNFQFDTSGNTICQKMGYQSCFSSQINEFMTLLDSNDRSCLGATQLEKTDHKWVSCSEKGFQINLASGCSQNNIGNEAEPYKGDFTTSEHLVSVICVN